MLRFFRLVTSLKSLNHLLVAFWKSFAGVAWVGVLALILLYMGACVCKTIFGEDPILKDKLPKETNQFWGSVPRSMMTLLQIMTGDGWISEVCRTFMEENPAITVMIIIFFVVTGLGLMNLLAAIYVDKLMQLTGETQAEQERELEAKQREMAARMSIVFGKFDEDGSGVSYVTDINIKLLSTG